ncbi:MAG: Rieske 2Fe-2S domain-containing protein [candidate division Zixibacteria bacterium]|nr:Rieske 2Fe-2S domain-containing protein [candidate division Zixibacteria bacterium]
MQDQMINVCSLHDVPEGKAKTFVVNDRDIVIARYDGKFYAFDNLCTHDGGILGDGEIYDGEIECPRHGARFDITTGEATMMPAVADIETYDVHVDNDDIFVALSD